MTILLTDLQSQFFYSIYNLYHQGSEKITVVDIDNYLQGHQILYVDFQKQNGDRLFARLSRASQ